MTETDLAMEFRGSTVTVRATIVGLLISHILVTGRENHVEVAREKLTANRRKTVSLACTNLASMARGRLPHSLAA